MAHSVNACNNQLELALQLLCYPLETQACTKSNTVKIHKNGHKNQQNLQSNLKQCQSR